jgi:ricin-type beta-trefoil lectin protein
VWKKLASVAGAVAIVIMPANLAMASAHKPGGSRLASASSGFKVPGAPVRTAPFRPERSGKPGGVVWQRGHVVAATNTGNMQYHGGPVQHHPQIYLVFWGTWWDCSGSGCTNPGSGNGDAVESYLYNYWHGVGEGDDPLVQVDSEYGDTNGNPAFGSAVWGTACSSDGNDNCGWVAYQSDPPPSPTMSDLAGVAAWGADYFGVEGDPDAQIIVVSPQGIKPDGFPSAGFCAWHSDTTDALGNFVAYTNMPYLSDAGQACDTSSTSQKGYSVVGGHEFSETVTDPSFTGWCGGNTPNCNNSAKEIGDLCAWKNLYTEKLSTGSFTQQPLWDNATGSCRNSVNGTVKSFNHRNKCMDDFRSHTANGTKVDIYSCNGTLAQTWATFPDHSLRRFGGYKNVNTGKCLDITGKKTANGTKVQLWSCTGGWNQRWTYNKSAHEWVNPHSGKCLDDPSGRLTNGTQLQIWSCNGHSNQQWTNV